MILSQSLGAWGKLVLLPVTRSAWSLSVGFAASETSGPCGEPAPLPAPPPPTRTHHQSTGKYDMKTTRVWFLIEIYHQREINQYTTSLGTDEKKS